MIQLSHITAGYGGEPVLRDLSISFQPGQVTVLVGPNGCGKSTLLRVGARLMEPQEGEILLDGNSVRAMSHKEFARHVALLPQSRPTPEITVGALVLHGRFPYLSYPRRYGVKDREAARRAMELVGVADLDQVPLSRLSGGQRQKVYLAMAVAQDTPVLLLDEPTTYLDISHQLELGHMAQLLAHQGKTVVMVLHDLNLALSCADQVAVMLDGQLQQTGTPEEIFSSGVLERCFQVRVHRAAIETGEIQYLFTRQTSAPLK